MIFLVVFVIKDPLELIPEADFDGLVFGVLPADDTSLGAGTAVIITQLLQEGFRKARSLTLLLQLPVLYN